MNEDGTEPIESASQREIAMLKRQLVGTNYTVERQSETINNLRREASQMREESAKLMRSRNKWRKKAKKLFKAV